MISSGGLRVKKSLYPELAIRELVANALIHQDFTMQGTGPMIEIFSDRIEITNPGALLPNKRISRLLGTTPQSRNEKLAGTFRRYRICEERGSGLIKAAQAVESAGLPALKFESGPDYFKVSIFGPLSFAEMTIQERIDVCYQHAVLKHLSNEAMTNTTLRQRLRMPERQRAMVSALIQEAIDRKLIKPADPDNTSRKFAEYLPAWA